MNLEQLVRPFQSRQTLISRRIIPSTTERTVETAGATWGKAGELPVAQETAEPGPAPQISFNTTEPRKVPLKHTETSRETEKVKITQTDNPDNYVVVERTKSIGFSSAASSGGAAPQPPAILAKKEGGGTTSHRGYYDAVSPEGQSVPSSTPVWKSGAYASVPADSELGRQIQRGEVEYIQIGKNFYNFKPPPAS